jgi:hypothetical protein
MGRSERLGLSPRAPQARVLPLHQDRHTRRATGRTRTSAVGVRSPASRLWNGGAPREGLAPSPGELWTLGAPLGVRGSRTAPVVRLTAERPVGAPGGIAPPSTADQAAVLLESLLARLAGLAPAHIRLTSGRSAAELQPRGRPPRRVFIHLEALGAAANVVHTSQARITSAITCGVAVSKPTTSSMPASSGSAMVKPVEVMPTTINFAGMPVASR